MNGHKTRGSDSSLFDEICIYCGATDAAGDERLDKKCPSQPKKRRSNMETELIRYPKDRLGNRVGCLYAYVANSANEDDGPTVVIGWSAYNFDDEVRPFLKKNARDIAKGRATKGITKGRMPDRLKIHLTGFLYSVNDAFKPARVMIVNDDRERVNG